MTMNHRKQKISFKLFTALLGTVCFRCVGMLQVILIHAGFQCVTYLL